MGFFKNLAVKKLRGGAQKYFHVDWFFDREAVIRAVDGAARRVLNRFGAMVRLTARRSIRNPRRMRPGDLTVEQRHRWHQRGEPDLGGAPSNPGEPPRNQTGKLKNGIEYYYDLKERSVTIGPATFPRSPFDVPGVLEHGGRTKSTRSSTTPNNPYIAARPYMRPALDKMLPRLMPMWHDSVRVSTERIRTPSSALGVWTGSIKPGLAVA